MCGRLSGAVVQRAAGVAAHLVEADVDDEGDHAIVSAIVYLGRSLRLCVVAEGVETLAQRAALQKMQCDQYQGYLCSPALPAPEFAALLARQASGSGIVVTPP